MKRCPVPLPTLLLLGLVAACGGQDAAMDDMDMGESPAATPPAAPAASPGGLSCSAEGPTHQSLAFNIGASRALLCYGAPSVQGRNIRGQVVVNGQPWPLGADESTTLHLSGSANVGGIALAQGSYSLYAIPSDGPWQFFINTNWQRPALPIDAGVRSTEAGSFTVTPQRTPAMVEQLRYEWEEAAGGDPGGELILEWENILLRIPIEA
jgi:hypothetical protein